MIQEGMGTGPVLWPQCWVSQKGPKKEMVKFSGIRQSEFLLDLGFFSTRR